VVRNLQTRHAVFPSGLIAVGADGRVPGSDQASAFDAISLAGELQGALLMSYMDAVCTAVGVSAANVVRAQYFLSNIRDFAGIAAAWQDRYGRQPHPFACVQVPSPMPASTLWTRPRTSTLSCDFGGGRKLGTAVALLGLAGSSRLHRVAIPTFRSFTPSIVFSFSRSFSNTQLSASSPRTLK